MANERFYSPTIPDPETMAPPEVRAIKIDEVAKNLPWIVTIDYGAIRMPYSRSEESILPVNSILVRNPDLIDYIIERYKPDLIVLNPDSTVKEVGELAKFAPVVVIVDPNGSSVNRVEEMYREGAAVVLDKSSHPSVLNGAINEVLRSSLASGEVEPISGLDSGNSEEVPQENPILKIGGLEINREKFETKYNGEAVKLSQKESDIVVFLAQNKDRVVSSHTIGESVWQHPYDKHLDLSLRVHISRIRTKLPGLIQTVRKRGYIIKSPLEDQS